jgi:hypothetical protein
MRGRGIRVCSLIAIWPYNRDRNRVMTAENMRIFFGPSTQSPFIGAAQPLSKTLQRQRSAEHLSQAYQSDGGVLSTRHNYYKRRT